MRILRSSVLTLMLTTATIASFAAPARAQLSIDVRVNIPPPPLPYYEQPVIPAEGYLWVPGFWAWDEAEADYYWVPGTWVEPPQPGLLWTPAYWGWVDGRYVLYSGYWAPEVGFYGGIDYGYGYDGDGYRGGRWDHGVFFYNSFVNNIESVRITNVYRQTVVVNRTSTNVSFNGGNGGTTVRPTPQQETIARERHVEASPQQRQQVETAGRDRALFSKQNHGEPAVAATPRAGVFQGAGVSKGSHIPVAVKTDNEPASRPTPSTNADQPLKAGEQPRSEQKSEQRSGTPEPRANEKEAPKEERGGTPAGVSPRTEEPRRPVQEPKAEEERRPPQEPKAEEERRPPQEPKAEEVRRPTQEPATEQERRPPPPPRAEEPRAPVQQPRPSEIRPAPARPAAPAGRPPAEEKKRE